MSKAVCVACDHKIDAVAKVCPYCGADPKSGQKVDTQALLREEFHLDQSRKGIGVLEFARQRQGIVVALGIILLLAVLAGLHQFVTARNATAVATGPAVPLSDITDLGAQANDAAPLPMPKLEFQYDGNPKAMQTYILEPGAVAPPGVAPAQQPAPQPGAAKPAQPAAPRPNPQLPAPRPNPQLPAAPQH